jgi:hypothetical protein
MHETRQYGIVDLENAPRSWHGTGVGGARRSIAGQIGTIRYAIQGNLLTGFGILGQAQTTFEATDGDLSQRVMAAMDRARDLGGDGRCSCNPSFPQSCGVPPPEFVRASLSAFLGLARMGDTDGECSLPTGCANGDYFLDLQFIGPSRDMPDPMDRLTAGYLEWRASRMGRPDHVTSEVTVDTPALRADGVSATTVRVELRDIDGVRLRRGGFPLRVEEVGEGRPLTRVGPVLDHGDGTYTFKVRAGLVPGDVRYAITVEDEGEDVLHYPAASLKLSPSSASGGLGDG